MNNIFDFKLCDRELFRHEFQIKRMATGIWFADFAGAYFLNKMVVTIYVEKQEADSLESVMEMIKSKLLAIPIETLDNPPIIKLSELASREPIIQIT